MNTIEDSASVLPPRLSAIEAGRFEIARDPRFYRLKPVGLNIAFMAMSAVEFLCVALIAFIVADANRLPDQFYVFSRGVAYNFTYFYGASAVVIGLIEVCMAAALGHFAHVTRQRHRRFASSGVASAAATFLLVTALLFLFKLSESYSRSILILQGLGCFAVVFAVRLSTFNAFQTAAAQGFVRGQRVVFIGGRDAIALYARRLRRSGSSIQVAFCPVATSAATAAGTSDGKASFVDAALALTIAEQCRTMRPDSVVVLIDRPLEENSFGPLLSRLREIPADVYAVPTHGTPTWCAARPAEIGGIAAFNMSSRPLTPLSQAMKRAFDIVASAIALILLSPLLLIAAALVAMSSPGPILFRQLRHGYNNRPIRVLKFRTMYVSSDDEFRQASKGDCRITSIGRLFRLTGIDELPQLWNILRGDMSVVGPRPHAIAHNDLFSSRIDGYLRRHTIKPGLTGLAQVSGFRGETDTFEKMQNRIESDLYYIDNWSFMLDMQIIFLTIFSEKTYTNAR
jgi:undecaprenyl-phosphate galactose phosphotransferase